MPRRTLQSLEDPRLSPYRDIKNAPLSRGSGRFIAEGEFLVSRLLDSDFVTESVVVTERKLERIAPSVPDDVDLFILEESELEKILGFPFHRGVIACGLRRPGPSINEVIASSEDRCRVVALPAIGDAENLGSIIRSAKALGVQALILGDRSNDPFSRRAVRVSMGAVLRLPILESPDVVADLQALRERGFSIAAAVAQADGEPLEALTPAPLQALVLGNEARGLLPSELACCDRKITIPIDTETDSLNVAVAAGILFYQLTRA